MSPILLETLSPSFSAIIPFSLRVPSPLCMRVAEAMGGVAAGSAYEGGELMVLNNVMLRCRMPRKATGEFDYMILRVAQHPTQIQGAKERPCLLITAHICLCVPPFHL